LLCTAVFVPLTTLFLVQYVGLDRLTNAYGLLSMVKGVATMAGPPVAGASRVIKQRKTFSRVIRKRRQQLYCTFWPSRTSTFGLDHPQCAYNFLFCSPFTETMLLSCVVFEMWRVICEKSQVFSVPRVFDVIGVTRQELHQGLWHQKCRVPGLSWDVVCIMLCLPVLIGHQLVTDRLIES